MKASICYNNLNKEGFVISSISLKIGEAALTGMLYEVGTTLKPGLVTPVSMGAHRDMDYFTFLRSTSSIAKAFGIFAQLGYEYGVECLPVIREYGIKAEQDMFGATGGVNTQKGFLFLGGIIAAAAGLCSRDGVTLKESNISDRCKTITRGITKRELEQLDSDSIKTTGEHLYKTSGITGIRGEVESGIPTVINEGLPYLKEAIEAGLPIDKALTHTLMGIMSSAEDTVVINRVGDKGTNYVKQQSKQALELGGMYTLEGEAFIRELDREFIKRNISPGGSADLLAATVMIYELERIKPL